MLFLTRAIESDYTTGLTERLECLLVSWDGSLGATDTRRGSWDFFVPPHIYSYRRPDMRISFQKHIPGDHIRRLVGVFD
jgi:hypothetical protein